MNKDDFLKLINHKNSTLWNPQQQILELDAVLKKNFQKCLWYFEGVDGRQQAIFNVNDVCKTHDYDDEFSILIRKAFGFEDYKSFKKIDKKFEENSVNYNLKRVLHFTYYHSGSKGATSSLFMCFLKHIRNSIAHGSFNIIGKKIYMYDEENSNKNFILIYDDYNIFFKKLDEISSFGDIYKIYDYCFTNKGFIKKEKLLFEKGEKLLIVIPELKSKEFDKTIDKYIDLAKYSTYYFIVLNTQCDIESKTKKAKERHKDCSIKILKSVANFIEKELEC